MTKPAVLLQYLRRTAAARPLAGLTDAHLLDHFSVGGPTGEAAFDHIVRRHGPMVLRVCRSGLDDSQADDAFQATFLVLVRRINAARRAGCLDAWLFGVARRICATARRAARRRLRHERRAGVPLDTAAAVGQGLEPDVVAAVHAEIGRLPTGERAPVVLCDLAGLSYGEAADRLGLTHAALRGRLARGRDRLRRRLRSRGIGPDAIWVVPVAIPAALAANTARAASVIAGRAAGMVPAAVAELLTGGLESMIWTKCKAAGLSALTAGVLIAGAVGLSARQQPELAPAGGGSANSFRAGTGRAGADAVLAGASQTTPAVDRQDPGDEVAALVRRAQRQQDRGDATSAMKTLAEVDAATKRWRRVLADQRERAAVLDQEEKTSAATYYKKSLQDASGGRFKITQDDRPGGVEDRLAAVEAKLDRLLRGVDDGSGSRARSSGRKQPAGPEASVAPRGGAQRLGPPASEADRELRPEDPRDGNSKPISKTPAKP